MKLWLCAVLAAGALARPATVVGQETGRITGVVVGSADQPVPGTNVMVVGTTRGALADAQGRFVITGVPAGTRQVRASLLGYADETATVEVVAGATATVRFSMTVKAVELQELVAVGYGQQKKASLTGAVAAVSPVEIDKRPVVNVSQALQGAAPGLTVVDRGGRPGAANNMIFIRGRGTLNSTSPLVLIDGVPDGINTLDANDIESVSVLKDAASAAIYGSRAANGVILITTKRGKSTGNIKWSYDGYYGRQSVERFPTPLGPQDYLTLINEAYVNAGRPAKYSDDYIQKTILSAEGKLPADSALRYPWTNWLETLWHPAPLHDQTLSARGGNDLASFSLSLNEMRQDGMVVNTDATRYAIRLNTDFRPYKRLSTGLDIALRRTANRQPNNMGGVLWNMFHDTPPTTMAKYPDGTYGWSDNGNNPLAYGEAWGINRENNLHGTYTGKADYQLLQGLTFRSQVSLQTNSWTGRYWRNRQTFYDYWNPSVVRKNISQNQLDERKSSDTETYVRGLLDFNRAFGQHSLSAMAGWEQTNHNWEEIRVTRQNFYNNDLNEINAGDASMQTTWGSSNDWALRSGFGRLNYNYAGKYLLEGNARYDGSSKFAPDNRYGFFPSVSAGWRISEEPFFKGVPLISDLKLRGSWGLLGNQDAQSELYPYYSLINLGATYVFNDALVTGASKNDLANQNIRWETTEMTDVGLDASFLAGRLTLTTDAYWKNTRDILRKLSIPAIIGLGAPVQNKLKVRNVGWEATAGWRERRGQFDYSANLNISHNNNKVVDLAGSGPYVDGIWLTKEGYPLGTMFGWKTDGLFQSADEVKNHAYQSPLTGVGDIKYVDQNGDGKVDAADRVPIGNDMPKFTFGSQLTLGWKNLDVSAFFQGAWSVNYWVQGALVEGPFWENYTTTAWLDRWTPTNPKGHMPKPTLRTSHNHQASDYWVYDASYMKLKNAQIGYTLPTSLSRYAFAERLRVYVSGQNLFTWMKSKDMVLDPENNSGRANDYPAIRTVSAGVSVSF